MVSGAQYPFLVTERMLTISASCKPEPFQCMRESPVRSLLAKVGVELEKMRWEPVRVICGPVRVRIWSMRMGAWE